MEAVDVVVLSGPPGVGKSSLAEEMFDQLRERDVRHAVIDVDALCLSYPFRAGDPYNNVTAIESVASVWANFSRQGIGRLVLVRVVESRADVERLLAAVPGARATVCHLAASPSAVEERIRRREVGSSTESLAARGRGSLPRWSRTRGSSTSCSKPAAGRSTNWRRNCWQDSAGSTDDCEERRWRHGAGRPPLGTAAVLADPGS